jgi:hypothetical protein
MSIPAELGSSGYAVVQFLLLGASLIRLLERPENTARTYWDAGVLGGYRTETSRKDK